MSTLMLFLPPSSSWTTLNTVESRSAWEDFLVIEGASSQQPHMKHVNSEFIPRCPPHVHSSSVRRGSLSAEEWTGIRKNLTRSWKFSHRFLLTLYKFPLMKHFLTLPERSALWESRLILR